MKDFKVLLREALEARDFRGVQAALVDYKPEHQDVVVRAFQEAFHSLIRLDAPVGSLIPIMAALHGKIDSAVSVKSVGNEVELKVSPHVPEVNLKMGLMRAREQYEDASARQLEDDQGPLPFSDRLVSPEAIQSVRDSVEADAKTRVIVVTKDGVGSESLR